LIERAWAMEFTHVPMAHGFVYLAVALDWFIRRGRIRAAVILLHTAHERAQLRTAPYLSYLKQRPAISLLLISCCPSADSRLYL
jgi:hypothetical protein